MPVLNVGICLNKVAYLSRTAADEAAARLSQLRGYHLHPYHCWCGSFHLTKRGRR